MGSDLNKNEGELYMFWLILTLTKKSSILKVYTVEYPLSFILVTLNLSLLFPLPTLIFVDRI